MILGNTTDSNKYRVWLASALNKVFPKLRKKNSILIKHIWAKVDSIAENPHHEYKHLHPPLHGFLRVHIGGSFVLVFTINHEEKLLELWWFDHRDKVYLWKP